MRFYEFLDPQIIEEHEDCENENVEADRRGSRRHAADALEVEARV